MSIATLKKKSESMYRNISVGAKQFSLNGSTRTQGYVGQTSLSRHLQRTPMKGNVIKGSGGCCGTYLVGPVVTSGVQCVIDCLNDPNVTKKSVGNTRGMLSEKYPNTIKNNVVKPDSNQNMTQGLYTELIGKRTVSCVDASYSVNTTGGGVSSCKDVSSKRLYRATNYNSNMRDVCGISKPEWTYVAMPGSDYISRVKNGCASMDLTDPLRQSSKCGMPLPSN